MYEGILLNLLEKQLKQLNIFISFDKYNECLDVLQYILWYRRTYFESHFDCRKKKTAYHKRHQYRSVLRLINYLLKNHRINENKSYDVNSQIFFNIKSVYFNTESCELVEVKSIFTVHKLMRRFIKLQNLHEKFKLSPHNGKQIVNMELEFSKFATELNSLIDEQRCISLW